VGDERPGLRAVRPDEEAPAAQGDGTVGPRTRAWLLLEEAEARFRDRDHEGADVAASMALGWATLALAEQSLAFDAEGTVVDPPRHPDDDRMRAEVRGDELYRPDPAP
jgi:hypothetical protein